MIFCMILIITGVRAQDMPYTNQTEAGLLLGTGVVPAFTVQMFNGVRINKWNVEAGLNAGIDIYPQITILPVSDFYDLSNYFPIIIFINSVLVNTSENA